MIDPNTPSPTPLYRGLEQVLRERAEALLNDRKRDKEIWQAKLAEAEKELKETAQLVVKRFHLVQERQQGIPTGLRLALQMLSSCCAALEPFENDEDKF